MDIGTEDDRPIYVETPERTTTPLTLPVEVPVETPVPVEAP